MKTVGSALVVALIYGLGQTAALASTEEKLAPVFTELKALKVMQPGQRYTVSVAGQSETGPGDQFLRRRTAQEISTSGLTCGCGDYALLFIERIEAQGFKTLLVDGAEISSESVQNHFSGHAVVAIRDKDAPTDTPWWLIDSTNLKTISRDWSTNEKSFQAYGHLFWIGYCGPRAEYPVVSPEQLKDFYARTLASVPGDFYNRSIPRLKFIVHASLIGPDGKYLNPRIDQFLTLQERILSPNHIQPQQEVTILLTRGNDDYSGDLTYSQSEGWISKLGLKSACSSGLLTYYESGVRRKMPEFAPTQPNP